MTITDGTRTVNIQMMDLAVSSLDWSLDFFCAGSLPYNDETDTYTVPDVSYCIGQAEDWKNCVGDFSDDRQTDKRLVLIEDRR